MLANLHTCIIKCIKAINCTLNKLVGLTNTLVCNIETLVCNTADANTNSYRTYATLANNNPMTVAAEYPSLQTDKIVYSTEKVRFLDMLNPNLVVLFKGTYSDHLPVYFKDTIEYEHIVTIGDTSTIAYGDDLVNNYPYPALYVGNYIILNPTTQTLDDFKNGLLN